MTAVFFVSGHGFGHASREVEVIHALHARRPDLRILIRSAVSPDLLRRTLHAPVELRPGACDTGIVQASSITHDDAATVREAVAFYATFDERVEEEARGLTSESVALVVGDIAPLAFEVAARLGVPGVAIANFTWDWIYEAHPGMTDAAPWLVPRLRRAYAQSTLALQLPFAGGFDVFPAVSVLPLVARRPTRARADTRAHFRIPLDRPAALLSFGGYGLPDLDLSCIDALPDWTIVTTGRSNRPGAIRPTSVVYLEEAAFVDGGFRYEDLVAAADAVVTKPGYGIIAECIAAGTPMLYTSRGHFREYDLLVREMPRFLRARFISQSDLFAGRWSEPLSALSNQPAAQERLAVDGAEAAARELTRVLDAST